MTNQEIREKINANNLKIESLMCSARFVLNHEINDLLEENHNLRQQCSHKYENHVCIYCDVPEEDK